MRETLEQIQGESINETVAMARCLCCIEPADFDEDVCAQYEATMAQVCALVENASMIYQFTLLNEVIFGLRALAFRLAFNYADWVSKKTVKWRNILLLGPQTSRRHQGRVCGCS